MIPQSGFATRQRYAWFAAGDINAFFGLMLDNLGDMILMASLLVGVFGMPSEFVLTRMIPGTAAGVMVGDLIYTVMAIQLARRTGRADVTAMPLGLDTPSTFGSVFLIIGPSYVAATKRGLSPEAAAHHAWMIGVAMLLASGIFKVGCSFACGWIRKALPRAGLLGSLTAIALVIISFLPLLDISAQPIAGFTALAIILVTLTGRWRLPKAFPGALAGLLVGCFVYYAMHLCGMGPGLGADGGRPDWTLRVLLPMPHQEFRDWWDNSWREALTFLPVAIPLALATIVGGIDCAESAAAAGDDYPTGPIIAVEGVATIVGGLFGGVIQSTPYIGHPAYKAMGARAGYTLATALFIGGAGILGYFDWIFYVIPKSAVFPILIFVGLEITSQSFQSTVKRHYPAVAFSCVPALAYLALIAVNQILPETGKPFDKLSLPAQHWAETVLILANGFIVTSLIWGTALAHVIDGKARKAALATAFAALFSLFGVIHSPLPASPILLPWNAVSRLKTEGRFTAARYQTPYHWAGAYAGMSLAILGAGWLARPTRIEDAVE